MSERRREIELLLLTIFAAVPLYATQAISFAPLIAFDVVMIGIVLRVLSGRDPELIPLPVMRGLAIACGYSKRARSRSRVRRASTAA